MPLIRKRLPKKDRVRANAGKFSGETRKLHSLPEDGNLHKIKIENSRNNLSSGNPHLTLPSSEYFVKGNHRSRFSGKEVQRIWDAKTGTRRLVTSNSRGRWIDRKTSKVYDENGNFVSKRTKISASTGRIFLDTKRTSGRLYPTRRKKSKR